MKSKIIVGFVLVLAVGIAIVGCGSLKNYLTGANTSLTSTSLSAANALRAMGITIAGTMEGSNWLITPDKISGEIMSIVIPVGGSEDEGIVAFGSGRPDLAPANSTLYPFDLSRSTRLHTDVVGLKPGYKGGKAAQIILLFGYFDVEFKQGTANKKIRFVYGDTGSYKRGDKLMYNPSGEAAGKFYWYDTVAGRFTDTRPSSPCANSYVQTFSDPVRPTLHYYMLGATLEGCTDYDGTRGAYITLNRSVIEDSDLSFTVDFNVRNAVMFTTCTSSAEFEALTDTQLIQKFDMKQNTRDGWRDTGLSCAISFEANPKFK